MARRKLHRSTKKTTYRGWYPTKREALKSARHFKAAGEHGVKVKPIAPGKRGNVKKVYGIWIK